MSDLLTAIKAYRAGKREFNAMPLSMFTSLSVENHYVEATYGSHMRLFLSEPEKVPETINIEGVREAISLALEEDAIIDRMVESALRSALSYLECITGLQQGRAA